MTTLTLIPSLPAAFQALNHLSQHESQFPPGETFTPHPWAPVLSYTSEPFLAFTSSKHHKLGILGGWQPSEHLTDKSLPYIPHTLPKLSCRDQWKKVPWKAAVIKPVISWLQHSRDSLFQSYQPALGIKVKDKKY